MCWESDATLELTVKSPKKKGDYPKCLKESFIFATPNTCISDLTKDPGRAIVLSWVWFYIGEFTSGERSKEMLVHIDDNDNNNEKILSYIQVKIWSSKLSLQINLVILKLETIRRFQSQFSTSTTSFFNTLDPSFHPRPIGSLHFGVFFGPGP